MSTLFAENEDPEDILMDDFMAMDDHAWEITLDDVMHIEEEENSWHKVQTFNVSDDGADDYFDERYFDE